MARNGKESISYHGMLLQAFKQVIIPELDDNVVSLNCVRDVRCEPDMVALDIVLPTFALASEKRVAAQLHRAAVAVLPKQTHLRLNMHAQVEPAVSQSLCREGVADVKNIILVASGKGGVGKSTVAAATAVALARLGCSVGLLDADVHGPSIPTLFGVGADQRVAGVQEEKTESKWMLPIERHGVRLMSMGFLVEPKQAMIWRGPILASACTQMFYNVAWGDLDYLIVDLPPGTGDIQLTIAQKVTAAGCLLVATPQQVALADVVRAKAMLDRLRVPILGLVENMSGFVCDGCGKRHDIFPCGGAEAAARELNVPFMGAIPLEPGLLSASDAGEPVVTGESLSPAGKAFFRIAHDLAATLARAARRREQHQPPATTPPEEQPRRVNQDGKKRLPVLS
ncbi:MAG: Mrp/NBP35 family ATP-binding protein [Myxococcota bacterium]